MSLEDIRTKRFKDGGVLIDLMSSPPIFELLRTPLPLLSSSLSFFLPSNSLYLSLSQRMTHVTFLAPCATEFQPRKYLRAPTFFASASSPSLTRLSLSHDREQFHRDERCPSAASPLLMRHLLPLSRARENYPACPLSCTSSTLFVVM